MTKAIIQNVSAKTKKKFAARTKGLLFFKPKFNNVNFDVFEKEQQQDILRIWFDTTSLDDMYNGGILKLIPLIFMTQSVIFIHHFKYYGAETYTCVDWF